MAGSFRSLCGRGRTRRPDSSAGPARAAAWNNEAVKEPSFADVTRLTSFSERHVPSAYEDFNGHMNIAHYLGIASEGLDEALLEVGIPKNWRRAGRAMFSAEHHLTYFHELRTNDTVSTRVRLIGRSERAMHVLVYLVDEGRQHVSYLMEEIFLCIDMATRKTTPWTPEIAERTDAVIARHAALPWAPELSGSMALR